MEQESVGKITKKFVVKLVLFFLLIDIVVGFIAIMIFSGKVSSVSESDIVEQYKVLNSFLRALILVNILAAVIPTLLATKTIKSKYVINQDNNKEVFRNIAIVLVIMAIIFVGIHKGIKGAIFDAALEDSKWTEEKIKDGLDDVEKLAEEMGIDTDEIKPIRKFFSLTNVYVWDGLAFIVMIGCEYYLIIKKEQPTA